MPENVPENLFASKSRLAAACAAKPHPLIMRVIPKKRDRSTLVPRRQNGRPRKLSQWQTALLAGLESSQVQFRRLKFNELVRHGDYIQDGDSTYRQWDGPPGFQAGSFLKKVYRPEQTHHT